MPGAHTSAGHSKDRLSYSLQYIFCTEARFTIIRTISLANVAFRHYKFKKYVWYSIPFLQRDSISLPQDSEWA